MMGLNNENADAALRQHWLIWDFETIGDPDLTPDLLGDPKLGNLKDPEKIAKKRDGWAGEQAQYPRRNKIICLGLLTPEMTTPDILLARDFSEAELVNGFWGLWSSHHPRVGFASGHFDLPTARWASWRNQIGIPSDAWDVGRHWADAIDLQDVLSSRGQESFETQVWHAKRLGIPTPDDYQDGSAVAGWYAAGDWEAIRRHCASDVALTAALAVRLGIIRE